MSKNNTLEEMNKEIEWFIKRTAVEAVNKYNKSEFQKILQNNDLKGLVIFINKYVPDFKSKLNNFVERNSYA